MASFRNNLPIPDMYVPGDDWDNFRESYEIYEIATELRKKPARVQTATLQSIIGPEGRKALKFLEPSEEQLSSTKLILDALEKHYKPSINVVYERYKFNTCNQGDDSVEDRI